MKLSKKQAIARLYKAVSGYTCADPSCDNLMRAAEEAEKHREIYDAVCVLKDTVQTINLAIGGGY